MNPPFEETILDNAATVVCNTFSRSGCMARLVMFTPNWTDSSFYDKLYNLVGLSTPQYAATATEKLRYGHVSGGAPEVSSLMFVFVGGGHTPEQAADFIAKCMGVLVGSVVARRGQPPPVDGWAYRGRGRGNRGGVSDVDFQSIARDVRGRGRGVGGRGRDLKSEFVNTLNRVVDYVSISTPTTLSSHPAPGRAAAMPAGSWQKH